MKTKGEFVRGGLGLILFSYPLAALRQPLQVIHLPSSPPHAKQLLKLPHLQTHQRQLSVSQLVCKTVFSGLAPNFSPIFAYLCMKIVFNKHIKVTDAIFEDNSCCAQNKINGTFFIPKLIFLKLCLLGFAEIVPQEILALILKGWS